ncbi:MAG: hypothetical protein JWL64_2117 [Frankiales bacterium]|nr:hypothetical protein [Frankiales bacterium]
MTSIGVAREDGVLLRSCPNCGRHAWYSDGVELSRDQLLKVLRESSPPAPRPARRTARPQPRTAPDPAPAPGAAQRAELQDLLRGFTVHGQSS